MHFGSAELVSGLHLSITGVLGFRTVHQVEPKAQLLLVSGTSTSNGGDAHTSSSPDLQKNVSTIGEEKLIEHRHETCETSDILLTPKFLEDDKNSESRAVGIQHDGIAATRLKGVQQAVVLAHCLYIERSTRHDEMQRWEMAPYIEAIDSQQLSFFMIQCFCDILRIRWESTRNRTKQRALVMMDKLVGDIFTKVQGVHEPSVGVAQRIHYCYGVNIPTIPALRKEYGDLLVSCGLVGEAVKVFEDLELWDNLIYCYRMLDKKAAAVDLIKTQLSQRPSDPRLWCSLGDITNNDACYEKALEVSENRSARAKRSLARSAYNRGDYETSKILWESAMALNSLYPDGWFGLGAAALKARDVEKALDGFTRAVQLDPENGEHGTILLVSSCFASSWQNSQESVGLRRHMIKRKSKEAFIAFKEALKFKRNSWQLWENYGHVAADVGNINQAMEAVQMVLELSKNKRIDAELLERIMLEIEARVSASHSPSPVATNNDDFSNHSLADSDIHYVKEVTRSEIDLARTRETEHLMELLGKILQRIVRSAGGAEIWGLYARWHKLKGDLTMCSEALLKQVRSYQGSDLWKDQDRFKKFVHASLELCSVYMELASRSGTHRELIAAEMHLKSTIKQASDLILHAGNFSKTEEFRDLQAYLDEVQNKLRASSESAA
ncbi:unnamed protein product [Ilex paraguariensis]|uniref:Tetratricopeptide repeat protein 27 homolog n=1 Tax=Ilex paraguariensis TaxID=185542 RepID=A0ABC8V3X5_9AQUA